MFRNQGGRRRTSRGSIRPTHWVEKVKEPVVESRPVEAVSDKVGEKVEEVADKVDEAIEKVEEPVVESKAERTLREHAGNVVEVLAALTN